MQDGKESASSSRRSAQLPSLAPRHRQRETISDRDPATSGRASRTPRLSHRSRAGCWTCRARKVKCDETRPVCGQCSRLKRTCDWEHRWHFSDATSNTQSKYDNVTTAGNTVWDPQADLSPPTRSPTPRHDVLPAFSVLTNDDDRERKAGTRRPGTFGVVVTPESFVDLPEYATSAPASRRASASSLAVDRIHNDPDVVVLDRFEDVSLSPTEPYHPHLDDRRPSLPGRIEYLTLSTPPVQPPVAVSSSSLGAFTPMAEPFLNLFRQYVVQRLIQPDLDAMRDVNAGSFRYTFEAVAAHFAPLKQAMCALSALNLSVTGHAHMDSAHRFYGQALGTQNRTTSEDELVHDGSFLRHFLLFLYDICIPVRDGDNAMSAMIHLQRLSRMAVLRNDEFGTEKFGYIVFLICELDIYACLLGSGQCGFYETTQRGDIMPPLEQQLPPISSSVSIPYLPEEVSILQPLLDLRQGVLHRLYKVARAARDFREEAAARNAVTPGTYARWQAAVAQMQSDLLLYWSQGCPPFLEAESWSSARSLGLRPCYVFEHAYLLYQTAILYIRTSMFSGQRQIPMANHQALIANTESRITAIVSLATSLLERQQLDRRHAVLPVFLAGITTTRPDVKVQALEIIKAFEGHGIGQNTHITRSLLSAVYEEQRKAVQRGSRMEDVEWLTVARERSLNVLNCGL